MDDPVMKGFVDRIDEIDALAQSWSGFIAQPTLPDEGLVYAANMLVNISLWESVENLREFTYASKHAEVLKMRADWFVQAKLPNYVLYWVPEAEVPTEKEIKRRFDYLRSFGVTPYVFTFEQPFTVEEMLKYRHDEQV
jgi:hypothetical protein